MPEGLPPFQRRWTPLKQPVTTELRQAYAKAIAAGSTTLWSSVEAHSLFRRSSFPGGAGLHASSLVLARRPYTGGFHPELRVRTLATRIRRRV
jgi:hypothetical protein